MFIRDVYKDLTGVIEVLERLKGEESTEVQVVVVAVIITMLIIKVFECSIEENGLLGLLACGLYYSSVSAGLLSKTPLGSTVS